MSPYQTYGTYKVLIRNLHLIYGLVTYMWRPRMKKIHSENRPSASDPDESDLSSAVPVSDFPRKVPKRLKFGTKTELVRAGLVRWKPDRRRRMVAGLVRFLSEHFAGLVRLESDEKINSKQRMGGIVALQW